MSQLEGGESIVETKRKNRQIDNTVDVDRA